MIIFLDETGSDRRDTLRKYGYSLRGRPITSHKIISRGKRVSTIAILSMEGILDCMTTTGSVDADAFSDFVEKFLLPHLMPFDGRNPHSVVILDIAINMIQQVGALVHFLPPYSTDLNPIEEAFSKVKLTKKEIEQEAQVTDHEMIVLSAFTAITTADCQQWIKGSGIYY